MTSRVMTSERGRDLLLKAFMDGVYHAANVDPLFAMEPYVAMKQAQAIGVRNNDPAVHAQLGKIYERCQNLTRETSPGTALIIKWGADTNGMVIYSADTIAADSSVQGWGKCVQTLRAVDPTFDFAHRMARLLTWAN